MFFDATVHQGWSISNVAAMKVDVSFRDGRIFVLVTAPNRCLSRSTKGLVSPQKHPVTALDEILHPTERLFPHLLQCKSPRGKCRSSRVIRACSSLLFNKPIEPCTETPPSVTLIVSATTFSSTLGVQLLRQPVNELPSRWAATRHPSALTLEA